MGLEFWTGKGLIHIKTDEPDLKRFFEVGFGERDYRNGTSYERKSNNTFHTTLWDMAESFFTHYTPQEFAKHLSARADDPTNQPEALIIRKLETFEDYVHPAFVFENSRLGRWNFWQIFCENMTSEEIAKVIPKKYVSKTKIQDNQYIQVPHTSPFLIDRRKKQALSQLSGSGKTGMEIAQYAMNHNIDELNQGDMLKGKFYRRWGHPIMIHDRCRGFRGSAINNLDGVLENLACFYPRFVEYVRPQGLDPEFMQR